MSFHFLRTPRIPSISLSVRLAGLAALLVFVAGLTVDAVGQDFGAAVTRSAFASSSAHGQVIVVGFLGGFVHRGDSRHPEVRLVRELRQEYPTGAYFGLFENSNIDEAYKAIVQQLNVGGNNSLSETAVRHARIILFGHSWGGSALVRLARKLDRAGIPVALTVQVDSVAKPFSDDSTIPPNVSEAVNFYQVHGFIHGRSRIVAANSERTRIIGNFRREYRTAPAECRNFSWYSRFFTKGHIAIECDPNLWSEVKTLFENYLPIQGPSFVQLQSLQSQTQTREEELGEEEALGEIDR